MREFSIGDRKVGPNHPPLVVVEVGINHEGQVKKAFQLVDAAADAGAELVKFQCHIVDQEMIPTDMTPGNISDEKLWDIIKRCSLTAEEERQVQNYCQDRGVIYLSTPFSREAADRLDAMDVPAFKIGSGECNNVPLLEHIASLQKPIILSTGMNDLASIFHSVEAIRKFDVGLALLQCTSMYPTPYDKVRLGAIEALQNAFPDLPVGLSDHSMNIWTSLGAVALGANIIEKHFTISRDWPGPDTGMSIEPGELKSLIEGTKAVWLARGGTKDILDEERPVIDFAYASVVTIEPVRKGETLSGENIWVKRPGDGPISAAQFDEIIGRIAARDIAKDSQIGLDDMVGSA